jgi:hypothetical protein
MQAFNSKAETDSASIGRRLRLAGSERIRCEVSVEFIMVSLFSSLFMVASWLANLISYFFAESKSRQKLG